MFGTDPAPRVFALPPGVDFAAALARGLRDRLTAEPPEAIARVTLLVPTARMAGAVVEALGPGYLPRITPLPALAGPAGTAPLARLLDLARLVRGLLAVRPELGPPAAAFGLARSLASLIDEMADEGVAPEVLADLDMGAQAAHWQTAQRFLAIATPWLAEGDGPAQRLRTAVDGLIDRWARVPPPGPVILAGSTASRGTTARLMQAVAGLAQGALVLPGLDPDLPEAVWARLDDLRRAEDHPQTRLRLILQRLGLPPVRPWTDDAPPDPARNRLISLALRPAPVTDQWRAEGAGVGDPAVALARVALIEAPGPRAEALAIARCLAEAVAEGRTAALVTPDRTLARRVTVALDRWGLRPDDSAGRPLGLTAPGRLLRQLAAMVADRPGAESLIALMKHPLAHSGGGRGPHLLALREFELWLRRRAQPHPGPGDLADFAATGAAHAGWAGWVGGWLSALPAPDTALAQGLPAFAAAAEALAAGPEGGSGALWEREAGQVARARLDDLLAAIPAAGDLTLADLPALLDLAMTGDEVRESGAADPRVMIWGTLEARARLADLVVLGGLAEGVWPETPDPDPWLNRPMRLAAGLRLPERQIGLSAHDFQIAAAAPLVVLSRAERTAEAETVPSRWLNRLLNLTAGLAGGAEALRAARDRGRVWLDRALADQADLSAVPPGCAARNPRPAPSPPVALRPRELRVTEVQSLIRDPYAIYARRLLGLERLLPLSPEPDARLRGIVVHKLIEDLVAAHPPGRPVAPETFLALARARLDADLPWLAERAIWLARLARLAPELLAWHAASPGEPALLERTGALDLPGVTLVGKPDRIDRLPDGQLAIWDYKTGRLPSQKQQQSFDKQLILLAIMATEGAFAGLGPAPVAQAAYVGLGRHFKLSEAPVDPDSLAEHRTRLIGLIARYRTRAQGYTARRALQADRERSDYDALSRLGEWRLTDPAVTILVGGDDG